MKPIAPLNSGQRIVVVIALAVCLGLFGRWVTTLGARTGWVAYAPLSRATSAPVYAGGLHTGWRILLWVALTLLWAGLSLVVLRSAKSN